MDNSLTTSYRLTLGELQKQKDSGIWDNSAEEKITNLIDTLLIKEKEKVIHMFEQKFAEQDDHSVVLLYLLKKIPRKTYLAVLESRGWHPVRVYRKKTNESLLQSLKQLII